MRTTKNTLIYSFLSLLLTACLLVVGCVTQKKPSKETASVHIPSLLPRNPSLGSIQEQSTVLQTHQDLSDAIKHSPTNYRKRLQLAQLFMLEARTTGEHGYYYPETLKVLDEILAEKPAKEVEFGATSLKASVLLSLHKFAEAKELAEHAVSLNGYNALIYGSLVDANVELGDYEEAVKMADKMISIRPDLRSYSRVSYLREIHGDLAGAISAMERAADSGYPGYEETAWCRLTLGGLYEKKGDLTSAQKEYERILLERPNYPFAIAALANIAHETGNTEQAISLYEQAIAIIPEVSFYKELAAIYLEEGKTEKADAMTQETLAMLADDEEKGHKMGMEYCEVYIDLLGDYETALEYAMKEYQARPANADVNQLVADIYLKMGDKEQASKYLEVVSNIQG